jgi:radical SAM superfamily enzyme YgiQ (UPF0313 family)
MSITLIYPPFTAIYGPPAALSALGPYLTERGLSVRQLDLNIEFIFYLWGNWPRLRRLFQERFERLARQYDSASFAHHQVHRHLRLTLPFLSQLRNELALPTTGDADGWDLRTARLLQRSLSSVVNLYLLEDLFASSDQIRVSMKELSFRLRDEPDEPVLGDFMAQYDWSGIDIVGFSLIKESQLPYAMLLARMLRGAHPGLRTVVGGPYITEVFDGMSSDAETFDYFDFLVVHEGESALAAIASSSNTFCEHPNVISRSRGTRDEPFLVEDIDTLPDQDFSHFNLDLYRPWGLSLPLYSAKGCTWARCSFCSVNFLRYRERDARRFWNSALRAARTYGVKDIHLIDNDVHPERLRQLAELSLASQEPRNQWVFQTRFYPELNRELLSLLVQGGFSTIEFGLETANQRTLKLIKKGISLQVARRIISDCEALGIKVILNFMIGFPWESETDAEKNVDFVDEITKQHPKLHLICNTQIVKVYIHSEFHRSPERYSVKSSKELPLSTISSWQAPEWVTGFIQRHRKNLLLTRRSSQEAKDPSPATPRTPDPQLTLAPRWYFLPPPYNPVPIAEWAGPLLVKATDGYVEAMGISEAIAALLSELGDGCRASVLKERFLHHFANFGRFEVLSAFVNALTILNNMGALSFIEDQPSSAEAPHLRDAEAAKSEAGSPESPH